MIQKCFICGKDVDVGVAQIPYPVVCNECADKELFDPKDWENMNEEWYEPEVREEA